MSFTDNQLKGNWAEQYIAHRLAAEDCLVRHVSQGQDSGIDLYCEKLGEDQNGKKVPYLHFWCQMVGVRKMVKSIYVPHCANNARSRFERGPRWRGGRQRSGGTRYQSKRLTDQTSEASPAAIAGLRPKLRCL